MAEMEIVEHRQIEGLSVFFDTIEYRTPHVHPEWELLWLLDQPLSVTFGQKRFCLEPGQMVLFCPNEPHEFHKLDKEATFLCLQISSRVLPELPCLTMDCNTPHSFLSESEMQTLRREISAIARAYFSREENYELYCIGQTLLTLYRLLQKLPCRRLSPEEAAGIARRNARLIRLIRFVDENYMHKIRLEDFAAAEGCSLSYLSRFIKNTMNQSFQEYVASVRFNCACKLIAAGEMRMLDICMESGFSDYRYFSRAFRQQYNMSPEEYSRFKQKNKLETRIVHHSLHSIERFYSRDDSLKLMEQFLL